MNAAIDVTAAPGTETYSPPSWVADYAPVVQFHPDEVYLPCSIEYLLEGATLVTPSGPVSNPTAADLYANRALATDQAHVEISASQFSGQPINSAPCYVCVETPPGNLGTTVDLNFFFLFAYNGPQGAVVQPGGFPCLLPTFGEHQGDIEGVTVRLDAPQGNIVWVRYEAHGDSTFVTPANGLSLVPGTSRPMVWCGLGSHATYSTPEAFETSEDYAVVAFGDFVRNDLPEWVWSPRAGDLVAVGLDGSTPAEPLDGTAPWAAFQGRLGLINQQNRCTAGVSLGNQPLPSLEDGYVRTMLALVNGHLGPDQTLGDGPTGLGARLAARAAPAESPWPGVPAAGNPLALRGSFGAVAVDDSLLPRPYAFVKADDGHLWVDCWDPQLIWMWADLGTPRDVALEQAMGAVVVDGDRPYTFVSGSDGNLWLNFWDGSQWNWANQGAPPNVALTAAMGA
ncbi:MAG: hypothetical protein QOH61_2784, partial [Chloroflexota bacterium]|nr:hypothetical protein [Chloroflexota bacterium]